MEKIAPMTLGNMRANGVRSLVVHCSNVQCRHEAIVMWTALAMVFSCLLSGYA